MAALSQPSFAPQPSTFSGGVPTNVVIACTFDPLGLYGPLQTWLEVLTGLRCSLQWIGYGVVLDALRNPSSAWHADDKSVNVLVMRAQDLCARPGFEGDTSAEVAAYVDALRATSRLRRGPTIVLLAPVPSVVPAVELTAQLRTVDGVHVYSEVELLAAMGSLRFHSPFLDRVAHAPYSPAGCSVFAGVVCRELACATAPPRKVFCLDCDGTLWGGAVAELNPSGVEMSSEYLAVQRWFVERQERGALLCLVSRNEEADVRAVLRERRDEMVLRDEHVVAIRASWGRKSQAVSWQPCIPPCP